MGVEFKDYYEVLHVGRSASELEIKSAYRKLARKHHPDLFSMGLKKGAEERFKEINEAYEVLGDKEKREKYDQLYPEWHEYPRAFPAGGRTSGVKRRKWVSSGKEGREAARGWHKEEETSDEGHRDEGHRKVFSSFFQSLFGAEEEDEVESEIDKGHDSTTKPVKKARGEDIESEITLTLEEVVEGTKRRVPVQRQSRCLFCRARGLIGHDTCPRCKGSGHILEEKELNVTIPIGVRDGDRIRLLGQGSPGKGEGGSGDRFIVVRVMPHAHFHCVQDHLEMGLDIMPWEAALGAERKIKTLYGPVILKLPAGTKSGQQFRLRGKGLPIRKGERQDLFVKIDINMPNEMTPEERQHYLELARLSKKK